MLSALLGQLHFKASKRATMQVESDLLMEAAARLMPRLELECHGKRAVFLGGKGRRRAKARCSPGASCIKHHMEFNNMYL